MPRTHAPILAALLGVGLVLVVTRSPSAEVRPVTEPAVEMAQREATPIVVIAPPVGPAAAPVMADTPPRGAGSEAIAIEAPEVLARFVLPKDRMALAAGTRALLEGKLAFDAGDAGARPTLVALVASWCAPCAAELPRLVELARAEDVRLVLVSLDDVAGPESLTAVIEDLFARAEPTSRELPKVELRADPDAAWTDATAPLLIDRGDPGALPQSLLLSGSGRLELLVQGGFDDAIAARIAQHLAALRIDATCASTRGAP